MKSFLVLYWLCLFVAGEEQISDNNSNRAKRAIPYAGQALQATSQVLNHPIVAAALQKISMDALATVASALNQVKKQEQAKKSEIEMSHTLDKMATLHSVDQNGMPLLQDGAGSGDDELGSGSGSNQTASMYQNSTFNFENAEKKTAIKKHKKHHHKHHHHHKHSKQNSKRNSTSRINWETIKNNSKIVGKIAAEANIPVSQLLAIFRSGASRSEIAQQTEELLNQTIISQADLTRLEKGEELTKEDDDKKAKQTKQNVLDAEINGGKSTSDTTSTNTTLNGNTTAPDYEIPKSIPEQCNKLVKSYTNGEMTLRDYLKQMKICKKNAIEAKQLKNTTPLQRQAVATQNLIQQEAYSYALNTMKSNFKPTAKETERAESIMDKWRTNSFGEKVAPSANHNGVPDAVRKFMTGQSAPQQANKDNKIIAAAKQMPSKPAVLNHITVNTAHGLLENSADTDFTGGAPTQKEMASSFLNEQTTDIKRTNIPNVPDFVIPGESNSALINKMKLLSGESTTVNLASTNNDMKASLHGNDNSPETLAGVPNDIAANIMSVKDDFNNPVLQPAIVNPVARSNIIKPVINANNMNQMARSNIIKPAISNVIQKPMIGPQLPTFMAGSQKRNFLPPVDLSHKTALNMIDASKKNFLPPVDLSHRTALKEPVQPAESVTAVTTSLVDAIRSSSPAAPIASLKDIPVTKTVSEITDATANPLFNIQNAPLVSSLAASSLINTNLQNDWPGATTDLASASLINTLQNEKATSELTDITASSLFQNTNLQNEKPTLLNGQELAAEQFIASLANPVLQEMHVDTSLVGALNTLSGYGSVVNEPKENLLLAGLQKREINGEVIKTHDAKKKLKYKRATSETTTTKKIRKRKRKRELSESTTTKKIRKQKRELSESTTTAVAKKHRRHRETLLSHGKRDTTDKVKSAKAIERSKMGMPLLNTQQGPKLMDKIRDMGRVIATP